jgi:hypothetical protein
VGFNLRFRDALSRQSRAPFWQLIWLIPLLFAAACTDGPNLSGEWRSRRGSSLIVSQQGGNYFVKAAGSDYMGKFKDDGIAINSPIGEIKYSREKDKLYWAGEEYARKEVLEAEAQRIRADIDSFVGLWKKVPHEGGETLAPFISIEVSPAGNFSIAEIQSFYSSSAFRNPQYNDGVVTGTFSFTIDNDHEDKFAIRKTSQDALNVTIGAGGAESFRRYVETDTFTGRWAGYYPNDKEPTFTFSVTKTGNRYRIDKNHFGTASALFARLRGGKLVAEGDPSSFYKFQPPTIEVRSHGELWYSDGADDVKLTRPK